MVLARSVQVMRGIVKQRGDEVTWEMKERGVLRLGEEMACVGVGEGDDRWR